MTKPAPQISGSDGARDAGWNAAASAEALMAAIVDNAAEHLKQGTLLKGVDWRKVAEARVAAMISDLRDRNITVPAWLCEALTTSGHALDDALAQRLSPVLRALNAANGVRDGEALPGALENLLSDLSLRGEGETRWLPALLRRLHAIGHGAAAARTAIRLWQHLPGDPAFLREAIDQELSALPEMRLAVLSYSTSTAYDNDLKRAFAARGYRAMPTHRNFSDVMPALHTPDEDADATLVLLDADGFYINDWRGGAGTNGSRLEQQVDALANALSAAASNRSGPLLVTTFSMPAAPHVGFIDRLHGDGLYYAIDAANKSLASLAQEHGNLTLIDSDLALADLAPVERREAKLWYYGRVALSAPAARCMAGAAAEAWRSLKRGPAKVLALDLDNTLWGGIVGEDGVEALACNDDFPGNAFKAFQQECLRLKSQGMLLAILSKNDPSAIDTFSRHASMLLNADDFVATRINWQPKPGNLLEIAKELNLGPDSFIFIDDSPHEREAMRRMCPMVEVPEMPADPAERPMWLRRMRSTWPLRLTEEDVRRSEMYAADRKAKALRGAATSFEDYLAGLEQRVSVSLTDRTTVARVAQMHARTNQFNLTTQRFDESRLNAMLSDREHWAVVHAHAADKFGDHGIVIAATLRFDGPVAYVETLLMSCRVIGRYVERAFIRELQRLVRQRGAQTLLARYCPTAKNGIVRDLYRDLGFAEHETTEEQTVWRWSVADGEVEVPGTIRVTWADRLNEEVDE